MVYTILKDYVEKNNPSFEDLQKAFPDEVQGSKGFIRKESDVIDAKRFNMREPLKIMNGAYVVVSNQWGSTNIQKFIKLSMCLGYEISTHASNSEKDDQMSQKSEAKLSLLQKIMKMLGLNLSEKE